MGLVQGQTVANADSVNLDQARKALETEQSTVTDIREPQEYSTGVALDAQLLPMRQLPGRLGEVPKGPKRPVLLICKAVYAARLPAMVKGPAACGKSRFIEHMAHRMGRPLITVAYNEDMTASDLVGRYLLDAGGTQWQDGPLTAAARTGAICYLDEIVEARQDTTVVIHPLTDLRHRITG